MKALLNIDAGEHEDEPELLYELADLVHVACGGHAGDDASMDRVVRACARAGTKVGAHPSYADREGFGRRALAVPPDVLERQVEEQIRSLAAVARSHGVTIASAKLHGALYHEANADPEVAAACVRAVAETGTPAVVGPARGELANAASRAGLRYLREAFADRRVRPDGSLVPRTEPDALVVDPRTCAARARELAEREDVDTICIHSDTPGALAIARAVREALGPKT